MAVLSAVAAMRRPHSARRRLAAGALVFALAATQARAVDRQDPYAVQAAMLVNVVKFVTWPGGARPDRVLRVCVVATARFAAALSDLARRGAPVEVLEVRTPARVSGCQLAVLGAALDEELDGEVIEQLGAAAVLTISEYPGAPRRGAYVSFVLEGERMRLEVNLAAARHAGFDISSKLLRLARVVEGSSP